MLEHFHLVYSSRCSNRSSNKFSFDKFVLRQTASNTHGNFVRSNIPKVISIEWKLICVRWVSGENAEQQMKKCAHKIHTKYKKKIVNAAQMQNDRKMWAECASILANATIWLMQSCIMLNGPGKLPIDESVVSGRALCRHLRTRANGWIVWLLMPQANEATVKILKRTSHKHTINYRFLCVRRVRAQAIYYV